VQIHGLIYMRKCRIYRQKSKQIHQICMNFCVDVHGFALIKIIHIDDSCSFIRKLSCIIFFHVLALRIFLLKPNSVYFSVYSQATNVINRLVHLYIHILKLTIFKLSHSLGPTNLMCNSFIGCQLIRELSYWLPFFKF